MEDQKEAREAIEDSRRTISESPYLPERFKATADQAIGLILQKLDHGLMAPGEATTMVGQIMNAVVVELLHGVSQAQTTARSFAAVA